MQWVENNDDSAVGLKHEARFAQCPTGIERNGDSGGWMKMGKTVMHRFKRVDGKGEIRE